MKKTIFGTLLLAMLICLMSCQQAASGGSSGTQGGSSSGNDINFADIEGTWATDIENASNGVNNLLQYTVRFYKENNEFFVEIYNLIYKFNTVPVEVIEKELQLYKLTSISYDGNIVTCTMNGVDSDYKYEVSLILSNDKKILSIKGGDISTLKKITSEPKTLTFADFEGTWASKEEEFKTYDSDEVLGTYKGFISFYTEDNNIYVTSKSEFISLTDAGVAKGLQIGVEDEETILITHINYGKVCCALYDESSVTSLDFTPVWFNIDKNVLNVMSDMYYKQ